VAASVASRAVHARGWPGCVSHSPRACLADEARAEASGSWLGGVAPAARAGPKRGKFNCRQDTAVGSFRACCPLSVRMRIRRGRPVRLARRPAPARPPPGRLRPQLRPAGTARVHAPAQAQQPARVPRTAPGPARAHPGFPGPDLVRYRLDLPSIHLTSPDIPQTGSQACHPAGPPRRCALQVFGRLRSARGRMRGPPPAAPQGRRPHQRQRLRPILFLSPPGCHSPVGLDRSPEP
jgi:hypothetical protein